MGRLFLPKKGLDKRIASLKVVLRIWYFVFGMKLDDSKKLIIKITK